MSKYEEDSFTNLVRALDAKWSHTYEGVTVVAPPTSIFKKTEFISKLYIPKQKE